MKRPLALFERALYLDAQAPMNVFAVASIVGQLDEQTIRRALKKLQARHEILGCLVVYEDGRPWFVSQRQAPPIPLIIVERRDIDWADLAMRESARCFDATRDALVRLLWLHGEDRGALLLVCHHAICDGRSLLILLDEILKLCGEPDRDIGGRLALKSIYECLPEKVLADRSLARRVRWTAQLFKLCLRLPFPERKFSYGEVYRIFWTLDEPCARMLKKRSKEHGLSVYSVILAAFMHAFSSENGAHRIKKFVVPVDVRRFLPHLPRGSLFAIAPTVSLPLDKQMRKNEWSRDAFCTSARSLHTELTGRIEHLKSRIYKMILGMEQLHDVYARMGAFARFQRSGRNVTLSYIGRPKLARDYHGFRLESVMLSAMLHPTPATLIGICDFAGQLDFSLASDEVSLPRVAALAAKEKAMALLSEFATSQAAGLQPECAQRTPSEQVEVH